MVLDVFIIVIVFVALVVGYQKGIIQPLMVELFFIGTLVFLLRSPAYSRLLERTLHANAILDVVVAVLIAIVMAYVGGMVGSHIHRLPVVRGVDGFVGIFVHVGISVLVLYLLLSALITLDKAFNPVLPLPSLTLPQVQLLEKQIRSNAITASLIDSQDLAKLDSEARTPGGARIETTSQLNQIATVYTDFLSPQLRTSRLAPVVVGIGHRVPVVGKVGPADVPRATPARTQPTPSPKPSATK